MSTLKVNTIRHTGASSDAVTLATDGTCTAKITNNLSNRRINANGDMRIAQRSTSTSTGDGINTVDRMYGNRSQGTSQQGRSDLSSSDTGPWEEGFKYSFKLTNTGSSSSEAAYREIQTRLEGQDVNAWLHTSTSSYITVSFWAKSSVAGTYYMWLRSKDGTNKVYIHSYTLAADTWKKVSFTTPGASNVTINNDNGVGLNVNIAVDWGTDYTDAGTSTGSWATFVSGTRLPNFAQDWTGTTNATFEVTGLQVEAGSTPSDYEFRSCGDELARCQRYYEVLYMSNGTACCYASGDSTYKWAHTWYFKQEKRAQASVALLDDAAFTVSGGSTVTMTGIFTSKDHAMFYYDSGLFRLGDNDQHASIKAESEI